MKIKVIISFFIAFAWMSFISGQDQVSIWVNGACGMCGERIENASMQIMGVEKASWDVTSKMLTVDISEGFYVDDLHTHIASVGHDTKVALAPDNIYDVLPSCCLYRSASNDEEIKEDPYKVLESADSESIWVNGVCGMCQERIESAAMQITGVENASWDIASKILTVDISTGFYLDDLHTHLASIGHDTKVVLAPNDVYNTLHACCLYRNASVVEAHMDDGEKEDLNDDNPFTIVEKTVSGVIHEQSKEGDKTPIVGATVYWVGTTTGTTSDEQGYFNLPKIEETSNLVVSYVGLPSDTINMENQQMVDIVLKSNFILDEVNITHRRKSTQISFINTMKVQNIDSKELLKAACCSLSESFETTPSVDVSFTDAITGTRKIELLGLAGPYVQVMRENFPYIRGLAALYGFSFTPGSWIESMQLNMGSGSVINGPESMTGQINVEVKKPNASEKLFINGYANQWQRYELNVNGSHKVNDVLSTAYLFHANDQNAQRDGQEDGFMDAPISRQFVAMNRWKYTGKNGLHSQAGIKGTYINKLSGQLFEDRNNTEDLWQADVTTERVEGWFKMGKVLKDPTKSVGFLLSASNHNQDAIFGNRRYDGIQNSLYSNFIFTQLLLHKTHKLTSGASFQYDTFDENVIGQNFLRNESLIGAFTEYNYSGDKVSVVLGLRADYHNNFGFFVTPRLHAKYSPQETTAFRLVAGRGQRTATIFAENIGIFASNRTIVLDSDDSDNPYGLDQEIAWNFGFNFTKEIILKGKSMIFSSDYYYTHFENQIVIDYDENPQEVHIYNLDGRSFSHSVQAQVDYELVKNVDVRLAYRFNDVQTDFKQGRLQKALTSRNRAFANVGWEIAKGWVWDGTLNFQGTKRIPFTASNPTEFQFDTASPSFFTFNSQVSKIFKNGLEIYLGGENIFNYRQENAIISPETPNSQYFDSSLVWGPIMGRNVYLGFRYKMI